MLGAAVGARMPGAKPDIPLVHVSGRFAAQIVGFHIAGT